MEGIGSRQTILSARGTSTPPGSFVEREASELRSEIRFTRPASRDSMAARAAEDQHGAFGEEVKKAVSGTVCYPTCVIGINPN